MPRCGKPWPVVLIGLSLLVACDSFDKRDAALQIRERFCDGWPYGCTDSTRVAIEDVAKTRHGRQVKFRVVDRRDRTAVLSAAYFEPRADEWRFLLFENPFKDLFETQASQFDVDKRRLYEQLRELKSAQSWFISIYSRYARTYQELDSVSYKHPELPVKMTVAGDAKSWKAEVSNPVVKCEVDVPRQQLPTCVGLAAANAGSKSGPLSAAFGEEAYRRTRFGKQ